MLKLKAQIRCAKYSHFFFDMIEYIRTILAEKEASSVIFKRNIVKEYLQILTLSFFYSHNEYRSLIFYGGSALRHCYELPRLSEDLDFVDIGKKISLKELTNDLVNFFEKKHRLPVTSKIQKFRTILKFPILHSLNLAKPSESDFLFLKIEVYITFDFCKRYRIEIKPVFKFGESMLVRSFDLPTLMATKIRAILYRKWERTTRNGKVLATVKGRDYYDLMWYLKQGIEPNINCIEGIKDRKELYKRLLEIVRKVDKASIRYDLESLVEDYAFVKTFSENAEEIISSLIEKLL
ncbi:MAG: nucleotidyl transferase AbiEii/AbiGii toxin family protein [bacterium]